MISRDNIPDTPDWALPPRPPTSCEDAGYSIPPNITLGEE